MAVDLDAALNAYADKHGLTRREVIERSIAAMIGFNRPNSPARGQMQLSLDQRAS